MDTLEDRTIYKGAEYVSVHVRMIADYDTTPDEFDCYDTAAADAWRRDEWRYVGVIAEVHVLDVPMGEGSLWGIEHGSLTYDDVTDAGAETRTVEADAFEWTPSVSWTDDAGRQCVQMGSPLHGVVTEALDNAQDALTKIGARPEVIAELETLRSADSIG